MTSLAEVLSPNPIEPTERPPSLQVLCRYEIGLGSHISFYLLVIRKFVLAIQLSRGRNIAIWRYWGTANLTSIDSLLDFDFLAYVIGVTKCGHFIGSPSTITDPMSRACRRETF